MAHTLDLSLAPALLNDPRILVYALPEGADGELDTARQFAQAIEPLGGFAAPMPLVPVYQPYLDAAFECARQQTEAGGKVHFEVADRAAGTFAIDGIVPYEGAMPERLVYHLRIVVMQPPFATASPDAPALPSVADMRRELLAAVEADDRLAAFQRPRLRVAGSDPGTTLTKLTELYYEALRKGELAQFAQRHATACARIAYAAYRECFALGGNEDEVRRPVWSALSLEQQAFWTSQAFDILCGELDPRDSEWFPLVFRRVVRVAALMCRADDEVTARGADVAR